MGVEIHTLKVLKDNFVYAITAGSACAVVDPGEAAPVQGFLKSRGLTLTHILCTHHHWDHVSGVPELAAQYRCEVWCSEHDRPRVAGATRGVCEGEALTLFDQPIQVLDVPGHTLGQIAYYMPKQQAVFPGDTLFSAGCGRLFEGTHEQMFASLAKFKSLPADTKIYFGHEYTLRNLDFVEAREPRPEVRAYREDCEHRLAAGLTTTPTTLATELAVNPFLRAEDLATFRDWREARNHY